MKTPPNTKRMLSDLLTRHGARLCTVTELAHLLHCTRQTLYAQLEGSREMSPTQAIRVARLMQTSTLAIVAASQYHQAHRDDDRALWLALWRDAERLAPLTL